MSFYLGDKVKVTVKGATWEDVVVSPKFSWIDNKIVGYILESGTIVCLDHITPIVQNIEPEPGDIVAVKDSEDDANEAIRIFVRKENNKYMCNSCMREGGDLGWVFCRVLARKPKRWEDMSNEERQMIYRIPDDLWENDGDISKQTEVYNKLISFIIGDVPYAKVENI